MFIVQGSAFRVGFSYFEDFFLVAVIRVVAMIFPLFRYDIGSDTEAVDFIFPHKTKHAKGLLRRETADENKKSKSEEKRAWTASAHPVW